MTQDSASNPPSATPEEAASARVEVTAPTHAGALVPAPSPAAPERHGVSGTGPLGKTRSPIGGWLLLIPTFGIYYLFWYHHINRELRDYDPSVKVKPGLAVLSLFVPVVGLISMYNTGSRIRQAQATSGAAPEASGLLGLLGSIVLALNVPYYSAQLNRVWHA